MMVDLGKAGIPLEFREAQLSEVFTRFTNGNRAAMSAFMDAREQGLFFHGRNGTGKTYTGCAILRRLIDLRLQVYRTTLFDLVKDYTVDWKMPRKVLQPAVIFLDELGKDMATKTNVVVPMLENLLRARFQGGKRCILAANTDLEGLARLYGPSVASLISGYCPGVEFLGEDKRMEVTK